MVIEVEDNGVGVDEHERTLIFQRFHRSDTVRAGFRGTGMGLSICQTIVQRHGGTIECLAAEPRPGVGVPLRPAGGQPVAETTPVPPAAVRDVLATA